MAAGHDLCLLFAYSVMEICEDYTIKHLIPELVLLPKVLTNWEDKKVQILIFDWILAVALWN